MYICEYIYIYIYILKAHSAAPPPRPHLLGHERQEWGEQTQQGREGQPEGMAGRFGSSLVALVGPVLDQFDMVVGERPEPGLGAFQCPGVVEPVKGSGGLVDEVAHGGGVRTGLIWPQFSGVTRPFYVEILKVRGCAGLSAALLLDAGGVQNCDEPAAALLVVVFEFSYCVIAIL